LFLEGIVIGILIGYIRKGSLKNIGNIEIRGKGLIILALFMQLSFLMLNTGLLDLDFNYYEHILTISYVLILISLFLNWNIKFIPVVIAGGLINFITYILNGWNIGVTENAAKTVFTDEILQLLQEGNIKLFKLIPEESFFKGGFIPWNRMMVFPSTVSIGDIIIFIGIILIVQNIMIDRRMLSRKNIKLSKDLFR
jgi:hypothetical protein